MPSEEMPERIWLIPDAGNDGETVWCDDPAPGAGMDPDDAVEYLRRDLCASGQQVRALMERWLDGEFEGTADEAAQIAIEEQGADLDATPVIEAWLIAIAALTPAPQPDTCWRCGGTGLALNYAGEPGLCSTCKGDTVTVPQPSAATPPQPGETVAEAAAVILSAIERAQIDMTILRKFMNGEPCAALRALKGVEANG